MVEEAYTFLEFNNSNSLIEPKAGTQFYFRMLAFKSIISSIGIIPPKLEIVFIDSMKDLIGIRIEKIAERFHINNIQVFKPVLIVGTKPLDSILVSKECDRRKLYLDSSIWIKYISDVDKDILTNALNDLNSNSGIFKANVAREFIELESRLLKESKLNLLDGHASSVSPFIFHSETKNKCDTFQLLKCLSNYRLNWNCLLIDDFASKALSGAEDEELTKQKIISTIIENSFNTIGITNLSIIITPVFEKLNGKVDNKDIVWKSLCKIADKPYDIILLDYLLGDSSTQLGKREYSHELLRIITGIYNDNIGFGGQNDFSEIKRFVPSESDCSKTSEQIVERIKLHKSPLNKFWFLNISSFQTAFLDRLREQGLSLNDPHWIISRGGDPVNTPNLFIYSLLKFMKYQIDIVDITKEMVIQHFITNTAFDNGYEVRDWAKSYYQIFISRFGKFHILKQDIKKNSLFSQSMYKFMINNRTEQLILYEKMRNFLFLLANGTYDDCGQLIKSHEELMREITIKQEDREAGKENEKDLDENRNETIKEKFNILREYIYNLRR